MVTNLLKVLRAVAGPVGRALLGVAAVSTGLALSLVSPAGATNVPPRRAHVPLGDGRNLDGHRHPHLGGPPQ